MLVNVTVTDTDCRPAVLYFPSGVPNSSETSKLSLYASDQLLDAEAFDSLQEDDEIVIPGAAAGAGGGSSPGAANPKRKRQRSIAPAPDLDTEALFAPQAQHLAVAAEVGSVL